MYFLLSGFNGRIPSYRFIHIEKYVVCLDLMDVRHDLQNSIESHGGKVIEKMPNAV